MNPTILIMSCLLVVCGVFLGQINEPIQSGLNTLVFICLIWESMKK